MACPTQKNLKKIKVKRKKGPCAGKAGLGLTRPTKDYLNPLFVHPSAVHQAFGSRRHFVTSTQIENLKSSLQVCIENYDKFFP